MYICMQGIASSEHVTMHASLPIWSVSWTVAALLAMQVISIFLFILFCVSEAWKTLLSYFARIQLYSLDHYRQFLLFPIRLEIKDAYISRTYFSWSVVHSISEIGMKCLRGPSFNITCFPMTNMHSISFSARLCRPQMWPRFQAIPSQYLDQTNPSFSSTIEFCRMVGQVML